MSNGKFKHDKERCVCQKCVVWRRMNGGSYQRDDLVLLKLKQQEEAKAASLRQEDK